MMTTYQDFTIQIIFESSVSTPLQSDTLFGHICWAIRYLKWNGVDKLADFLSYYDKGSPPLLISNGFPKGYLPKPVIPPVTQKDLDQIVSKEDRIEESFKIKTIKKTEVIPRNTFAELQKDMITPVKLFEVMYDKVVYESITNLKAKEQSVLVQHNTIDRIKGSVREGALFSQEETFFSNSNDGGCFELYLKTNYFSSDDLNKIFTYIGRTGFGKDKSTGKGAFNYEIKEGIDISEADKPNAFMTLSSFVPFGNDPIKGYYNIIHKYGKLGGHYAQGTEEALGNPFKVPLIMFSAGSVFFDDDYKRGKVYGSLLKNVHKNKDIRHYAYAFPIGINIEVSNEDT
jgi:CRISPR-associated protein Csm4